MTKTDKVKIINNLIEQDDIIPFVIFVAKRALEYFEKIDFTKHPLPEAAIKMMQKKLKYVSVLDLTNMRFDLSRLALSYKTLSPYRHAKTMKCYWLVLTIESAVKIVEHYKRVRDGKRNWNDNDVPNMTEDCLLHASFGHANITARGLFYDYFSKNVDDILEGHD